MNDDTDELYGELSLLTALVNEIVKNHQVNLYEHVAHIPLPQFSELERGAIRATATIVKHASR